MPRCGENVSGEKSPSYKGGKWIIDGYVSVYDPTHPLANTRGRVSEHRLVMEKHLGRYLTKDEVVHHINGIKTDNRIENLKLWNPSDHAKYHASIRKRGKGYFLKGRWSKKYDQCIECGTTEKRYSYKGKCTTCASRYFSSKKTSV